ncbi:hypothetical protein [Nostoc sp.]|uniref:hypothetical protein n=1 Tax=Nostoc sp. TaxID=1180 RepID=UPI002FF969D7
MANSIPANLRRAAFQFLNLAVILALLPASLLASGLWQTLRAEAIFIASSLFALASKNRRHRSCIIANHSKKQIQILIQPKAKMVSLI